MIVSQSHHQNFVVITQSEAYDISNPNLIAQFEYLLLLRMLL